MQRVVNTNDPATETFVVDQIEKLVKEAEGDVVIIVDACVFRYDVRDEVKEFLKKTGFPVLWARRKYIRIMSDMVA